MRLLKVKRVGILRCARAASRHRYIVTARRRRSQKIELKDTPQWTKALWNRTQIRIGILNPSKIYLSLRCSEEWGHTYHSLVYCWTYWSGWMGMIRCVSIYVLMNRYKYLQLASAWHCTVIVLRISNKAIMWKKQSIVWKKMQFGYCFL